MAAEWTKLCRAKGLSIDGEAIDVELAEERRHRVQVRDGGSTYELLSIVAQPRALESVEDPPLLAWRRNRGSQLVGFRIDRYGRLVGEAWVPKVGLTADEFQTYVRRLAAECDRFEYQLTGKDTE